MYGNVTHDDPDIVKYRQVMDQVQDSLYVGGILTWLHDLGHKYISGFTKHGRTLEIGYGRGRQGNFFKGNPADYYPTELNTAYLRDKKQDTFSNFLIADARCLPFPDNYFDQVVSVYNLEHIDDLDSVFNEILRVMRTDGSFIVGLPCEGGLAWNLGRELTTRRNYQKAHGFNYDKVIAYEHVHDFLEVQEALQKYFHVAKEKYFPFYIKSHNINLIYSGVYIPKDRSEGE